MMKHKIVFILAGVLLVLAAFMKFAMIGYGFIALVLTAIAAAAVLFVLLPPPLKIALAIVTALFLAVFCFWEVRIVGAAHTETPQNADYLIVLGCGVRGTTPSVAMRNRTDAAAKYLKENPDTVCICSGGRGPGEDITEALAMKQLISGQGVDPSRILMEEKSTSTEENLRFSAAVIEDYGGKIADQCIVICSSEYHIFRAMLLSEKCTGVRFEALPAKSTLPVSRINYYLREAAGMMVLSITR